MAMIKILDGAQISPYNPFAGEGESDLFASYAPATLDRLTRAGLSPGDFFRFREGVYMLAYNRSGSSTAVGNSVCSYQAAAARVATITSATAAIITCSGAAFDVPDSSGGPGLIGKLCYIKTGTGTGQVRRILDNTATTITVSKYMPSIQLAATDSSNPNALTTVPVNTDTLIVVGFDEIKKTTAVTDNVVGVAMAITTDGSLGIFQVGGPVMALVVGSTDATTVLGPVGPSATAGTLKGPTAAGETAAEARLSCGVAFDAYAGAAALRLIFLTGKNVIGACAPPLGVL